MSVVRKEKAMYPLVMGGLTLMAGALALIVSRHTRNSMESIVMAGKRQINDLFLNRNAQTSDEIDQQSEASFPASDSPSWSGTIAGGSH